MKVQVQIEPAENGYVISYWQGENRISKIFYLEHKAEMLAYIGESIEVEFVKQP